MFLVCCEWYRGKKSCESSATEKLKSGNALVSQNVLLLITNMRFAKKKRQCC
jgi:hypothetical protein